MKQEGIITSASIASLIQGRVVSESSTHGELSVMQRVHIPVKHGLNSLNTEQLWLPIDT